MVLVPLKLELPVMAPLPLLLCSLLLSLADVAAVALAEVPDVADVAVDVAAGFCGAKGGGVRSLDRFRLPS